MQNYNMRKFELDLSYTKTKINVVFVYKLIPNIEWAITLMRCSTSNAIYSLIQR